MNTETLKKLKDRIKILKDKPENQNKLGNFMNLMQNSTTRLNFNPNTNTIEFYEKTNKIIFDGDPISSNTEYQKFNKKMDKILNKSEEKLEEFKINSENLKKKIIMMILENFLIQMMKIKKENY